MQDTERASERTWLEAVLERYEGPLIRYAARITGDVESARDVVQDTFLRLCTADRAKLNGHEAEWLFTVCRNRATDVRRKELRMTPLTESQEQTRTTPVPPPPARLQTHESTSQVLQTAATLPPDPP